MNPILALLIALGLILWLLPFERHAATLNEIGKWMAVLAYAAYLWTMIA